MITERQKLVLGLLIQEYIETSQPISSKRLVENFRLDISSATVRNELAALTDQGLIRQPHTSAGRVPTEEGYRYFVSGIMRRPRLPDSTRQTISHQFFQARYDSDQWMRLAASVLAHQSSAAALVTAPKTEHAQFKHLELISTMARQVLLVLVLTGGKVIQQMLVLKDPVSQEALSETARKINGEMAGVSLDMFNAYPETASELEMDIYKVIGAEGSQTDLMLAGDVFHDGWTNVLAEPEFAESENARKALRVLEEHTFLEDLISQTMENSEVGGVQVLIAGEGNWEELSECSLVLARYGVPEIATGFLGVLGPVRMPYGHMISTVHYVAGLLSDMVSETMHEDF